VSATASAYAVLSCIYQKHAKQYTLGAWGRMAGSAEPRVGRAGGGLAQCAVPPALVLVWAHIWQGYVLLGQ